MKIVVDGCDVVVRNVALDIETLPGDATFFRVAMQDKTFSHIGKKLLLFDRCRMILRPVRITFCVNRRYCRIYLDDSTLPTKSNELVVERHEPFFSKERPTTEEAIINGTEFKFTSTSFRQNRDGFIVSQTTAHCRGCDNRQVGSLQEVWRAYAR